jgi:Family of unknown function (DUF5819)
VRPWWSRALVGGTVVVVCALVAWHLTASFLYNAPRNPVSHALARPVAAWMDPVFAQNWQLFAPNPISENIDVQARASLSATGDVTAWYDLSAADAAAERGDPAPTHLTENGLRNAWLDWSGSHDAAGDPTGPGAAIAQQYLIALVRSRLSAAVPAPLGSIQLRVVTSLIPGPGRTAAQTAPHIQVLSWWPV